MLAQSYRCNNSTAKLEVLSSALATAGAEITHAPELAYAAVSTEMRRLHFGATDMAKTERPRADLNRDRWIQSPEC